MAYALHGKKWTHMLPLIMAVAALAISFVLIYFGAKKTLQVAVWVSSTLGLSKVITGCVLVGFITALPELMGSLIGVLSESPHLAFGNILGSNIYNIPLVIGLCGLIGGFTLENSQAQKERVFMIGLTISLKSSSELMCNK